MIPMDPRKIESYVISYAHVSAIQNQLRGGYTPIGALQSQMNIKVMVFAERRSSNCLHDHLVACDSLGQGFHACSTRAVDGVQRVFIFEKMVPPSNEGTYSIRA